MDISRHIYEAGVVGAGGAGFPTHVKAASNVEFMLANGAECEPLLHKDYELMLNFAPEIVEGMQLMMASTKAAKGIFGIKSKNQQAIDTVSRCLADTNIDICELGDFYPSGDEYELVYSATKRLMPPFGIPLNVGCVVNNVESLYNVFKACNSIPLTEKFLCVTGAVKQPCSFFAPIGMTYRELIEFAGGASIDDFGVFAGGVMMGNLTLDLDEVVTKTTSGLIILPKNHYLIKRKSRPESEFYKIGKSACDQCSYCTELCPRYLLGYDVQPHKVMRSLAFTRSGGELWNQYAELCCACGLCTLYSCPEELYPKEACDRSKMEMRQAGMKFKQTKTVRVHPVKEGRRVPIKQLMRRLNILSFEAKTPFRKEVPEASLLKIKLKQHIGQASEPVVKAGDKVSKNDLIAAVPIEKMGANIHAPIKGSVIEVTKEHILIGA